MRRSLTVAALIVFGLSGCASLAKCKQSCAADAPPVPEQPEAITQPLDRLSHYDAYPKRDETFGTPLDYHQLAIAPRLLVESLDGGNRHRDLNLSIPIYVVGIEKVIGQSEGHFGSEDDSRKARKQCIGRDFQVDVLKRDDPDTERAEKSYDAACQSMNDRRPMLLTHIVRSDGIAAGLLQAPCNLFSVYRDQHGCGVAGAVESPASTRYDYSAAVAAVDALRSQVTQAASTHRPTHLLLLSTGWNTHQDESLYNYLDWLQRLQDASDGGFRPLVVAITWQSAWDRWPPLASALTKGNDADEIGLTWANRVLNDVLLPAATETATPVVMIGHSYGTRVLGAALFDRRVIKRDKDIAASGEVPLTFIALQPAFPLQRFGESGEPLFYGATSLPVLTVMTASKHDHANSGLDRFWGAYAGSGASLKRAASKDKDGLPKGIAANTVDETGRFEQTLPRSGFYLTDASAIVDCAMPNTGGGAHSAVYSKEIGRLMWQAIQASTR